MAGQLVIEDLLGRIDTDTAFATALATDTFAALEDAGLDEWAQAIEQQRDRVGELVDRIFEDDRFREAVETDPTRILGEWGLPQEAVEPLLELVGAPGEVIERATADVEAHLGKKPATVAAMTAMLGALAFAQQAGATTSPAKTAPIARPQVTHVSTSPEATAPAVTSPIAKAQARPAAHVATSPANWHFAAHADARWQSRILSILRAQGSLLR
jgi:hypothetical protein